jgi:hypothetical protein
MWYRDEKSLLSPGDPSLRFGMTWLFRDKLGKEVAIRKLI